MQRSTNARVTAACDVVLTNCYPFWEGVPRDRAVPYMQSMYARVKAVMAIPKGTTVPALTAETVMFDIEDWDASVFDGFSENLKKTIENSEERKKSASLTKAAETVMAGAASGGAADDIPF